MYIGMFTLCMDAPCEGVYLHTYQYVYGVLTHLRWTLSLEPRAYWSANLSGQLVLGVPSLRCLSSAIMGPPQVPSCCTGVQRPHSCMESSLPTEPSAQLLSHDYFQMYLGRKGVAQHSFTLKCEEKLPVFSCQLHKLHKQLRIITSLQSPQIRTILHPITYVSILLFKNKFLYSIPIKNKIKLPQIHWNLSKLFHWHHA